MATQTATSSTEIKDGIGFINIVSGDTLLMKIPFSEKWKGIIGDMNPVQAKIFANSIISLLNNGRLDKPE